MRIFNLLGLACLALALPGGVSPARAEDPARTLAGWRGQHRALLVFAASVRDPLYLEQRRLWESERAGFVDRDLMVLPMFATALKATPLAGKYTVRPGAFTVILVGKDGNEAFRSVRPVPASELYGRIDAMPMRREESHRKAPVGAAGR